MRKTKIIIFVIILGIIFDISSFLIAPKFNLGNFNESTGRNDAIKGFPIGFVKATGCQQPIPGCQNFKLLPLNFALNLLTWILIAFLIVYICEKLIKLENKKI